MAFFLYGDFVDDTSRKSAALLLTLRGMVPIVTPICHTLRIQK